jgi:hypothetical protein
MPARALFDTNGFLIKYERLPDPQPSAKPKAAPTPSPSSSVPKKPLVVCSLCGVNVREDRLPKHMFKVHPSKSMRFSMPKSTQTTRDVTKKVKTPSTRPARNRVRLPSRVRQRAPTRPRGQGTANGYLEQIFDDPRYGGKYIGQTLRESDGSFGSIPLNDNYSEESGPE